MKGGEKMKSKPGTEKTKSVAPQPETIMVSKKYGIGTSASNLQSSVEKTARNSVVLCCCFRFCSMCSCSSGSGGATSIEEIEEIVL